PGSRQQAVRRSRVRLTRNQFLAYAISNSGRETAAPDGSQQSLRLRRGAASLLPVSTSRRSPLCISGVLRRQGRNLRSSGVAPPLVSCKCCIYGEPRLTHDVDLIVELNREPIA